MRRYRQIPALVAAIVLLFAAVPLLAQPVSPTSRLPRAANAVMTVDVAKLMNSPLGKQMELQSKLASGYADRPLPIPATAKRIAIAALVLSTVGLVIAIRRPTREREAVFGLVLSILLLGFVAFRLATAPGFVDSAALEGEIAAWAIGQTGEVSQVTCPDAPPQASGAVFTCSVVGASGAEWEVAVTVHADSASLDHIGEIVGQEMKGAAVVDATVTGNARELKASGTLTGSNVGRGDNEALSLKSTFTATIPDLQPASARVQASSTATRSPSGR